MKNKFYLAIDDVQRSMIINSLNCFRNKLLSEGKHTDVVDEALIKLATAKKKKFKIIYTEE